MPTDEPISGLPAAGTLNGSELVPMVQSGITVQTPLSSLSSILMANRRSETHTVTGTTLAISNVPAFVFAVYQNGQYLTPVIDYSITLQIITFTQALSADSITAVYLY